MESAINPPFLSFFIEFLQFFNCTNRKETYQALCTFQKKKTMYVLIKEVESISYFQKAGEAEATRSYHKNKTYSKLTH